MVNRGGLLLEDRRCSRESAGREGGSRWLVVEGGVRRVFGRPLGATTGFVIGRPHDTWRDHRAFFRPDRFWKRARVRRSISAFLRRIFFLFFFLRSATKRRRRATRPSSSLLLLLLLLFPLLARDEIKLWPDFASPSSPRAPSFSFLSLATPPSLHAFFFYRRWQWWRLDVPFFDSFFLSLSLRRERSASKSFPLFFLEQFSSFASTLCRRSRTSEGSFERLGGQREDDCTPSGIATRHSHSGAVGEIGSPTDRIFAGSTVRAILESKKENTKPCCLGKNDGYLLDNDTTYRDRPVSPGFRFARRITVNLQSITLLSLLPLSKNLAQKKKEKKNLSIVIERTLLCNEIITIQYKLCMYVYGRRFFCSIQFLNYRYTDPSLLFSRNQRYL